MVAKCGFSYFQSFSELLQACQGAARSGCASTLPSSCAHELIL